MGLCVPVWAQGVDEGAVPLKLKQQRQLDAAARPGGTAKPALVLRAARLNQRLEHEAVAEGGADLRYGNLQLKAQTLSYDSSTDLARAEGEVELQRNGNLVRGPGLQLFLDRFEGEFLKPEYFFALAGAGGQADRLQFLGSRRLRAENATYSSCMPDEAEGAPAWQLRTRSLALNFDANEGVATGAVLRFMGVPILAAPSLSFPLGEGRKSGWLPPNIEFDERSGVEFGLPYYWNIAPQRDATFTPFVMTRRGWGVDSELRYLEPRHQGQVNLAWLPHDRLESRSRWDLRLAQSGQLPGAWRYELRSERVSDDAYWKDLPKRIGANTPRLLSTAFGLERHAAWAGGELHSYARVQRWQALQGTDTSVQFDTPYQRSPQLGLRYSSRADDVVLGGYRPWGRRARLEGTVELEYNRFDLSRDALPATGRNGQRLHLLATTSLPMGGAAWWLVPRLSMNAASYRLDAQGPLARTGLTRSIPSFSLDHGWVFERQTQLLGRPMVQSLEPRALYLRTPYRDQRLMPLFDSAPRDFNIDSIFADNQFSGVDRVSDANQLTLGATSRWLDAAQGEEMLRLGLVQRFLFQDQRITPDEIPVTQRSSDVLLVAASHLSPRWWTEGVLQFSPETQRAVRSVLRARYSPEPTRTVSVAYRLARNQSEQVEVAWQWPLFGAPARSGKRTPSAQCKGAWYSAGRLQYSLRDRRLTDSLLGMEYDAGCWILRVGAERLSTGRTEANTRVLLQIELVGLAQLGSNALQVLKDNIPGYRQLSRDGPARSQASYD